ncbi:DUF6168 family protein [Fulvivirga sediminis]|uniref:Uncharacterized protein n=1 Tax=Fulvivirga sediminis TaxID=2803949 RepID=A0A937K1V7_9BACT|nr:DUF6168 family protein [Fulvivirga sediminis]MBL3657745.1 hypothetical protein [Fulvivirga sediminis]
MNRAFKRLLIFFIVLMGISVAMYSLQIYVLSSGNYNLHFELMPVYIFHFIATLLVCVLIEAISSIMPNQAGYAYLGSIFIKIGLFLLIFKDALFMEEGMNKPEKLSIVIPMLIFLMIESVYCGRLLNAQQA